MVLLMKWIVERSDPSMEPAPARQRKGTVRKENPAMTAWTAVTRPKSHWPRSKHQEVVGALDQGLARRIKPDGLSVSRNGLSLPVRFPAEQTDLAQAVFGSNRGRVHAAYGGVHGRALKSGTPGSSGDRINQFYAVEIRTIEIRAGRLDQRIRVDRTPVVFPSIGRNQPSYRSGGAIRVQPGNNTSCLNHDLVRLRISCLGQKRACIPQM